MTPDLFQSALARLAAADVAVAAAGLGRQLACVAVQRRDGADALRLVEAATEAG